jgi:hypothetical protein
MRRRYAVSVVSSLIAPHVMCTAQKSGHARESNAVKRASAHCGNESLPRGRARGPTGCPAASRKRARARPWKVSSYSQHARKVATSGSSIARVASNVRV